jgi:hypothetical protein
MQNQNKNIHAHVQIAYTRPATEKDHDYEFYKNQAWPQNQISVESMVGFDPKKNREFVHKLMDEFLDNLEREMEKVKEMKMEEADLNKMQGGENYWNFQIFGEIDTH